MADGLGPWVSLWHLLSQKRKVLTSSGSQIWFQEMNVSHLKPKPPAQCCPQKRAWGGQWSNLPGRRAWLRVWPGIGTRVLRAAAILLFFSRVYISDVGVHAGSLPAFRPEHIYGVLDSVALCCAHHNSFFEIALHGCLFFPFTQSFHSVVY